MPVVLSFCFNCSGAAEGEEGSEVGRGVAFYLLKGRRGIWCLRGGGWLNVSFHMERKEPIKKDHIKEFGGRDALEASQGQTRDVPGTPGTFGPDLCVNQY